MQQLSINLQRTKALLIGVSEYEHLPKIAPAMGNLDDLFSVLTNPAILGLPAENITLIRNKRNDEILRAISQFVKNEKNIDVETLILYYVGHGVREVDSKKLYLTGTNSDSEIIAGSAILYDEIKKRIENSQIQHRIVLLDACHSGLSTQSNTVAAYTQQELDVKGTYILASSAGDEKSHFDTRARNTFFTAEILRFLCNGLPAPPPVFSLDDVFEHLKHHLKYSTPQRKTNLNTQHFYTFLNCAYNNINVQENKAKELYDNMEFEAALNIYLDLNVKNQNQYLIQKIQDCRTQIELVNRIKQKYSSQQKNVERTKHLVVTATKPINQPTEKQKSSFKEKLKKFLFIHKSIKVSSKQGNSKIINTLIGDFIYVDGGSFKMGDEFGDLGKDSHPVHQVTLSDFYIAKTTVTQKQWREIMGKDPEYLTFKGNDNNPVENVSWNDVQTFLEILNKRTIKIFRLPTEAEWEYAARGGKKSNGYKYSGSDNIDEVAWHDRNNGNKTQAVAKKRANELGLYDMSGNVWEWCNDWYGAYYSANETNPQGAENGSYRVTRGGGWFYSAGDCRSALRSSYSPGIRNNFLGFRLVLVP